MTHLDLTDPSLARALPAIVNHIGYQAGAADPAAARIALAAVTADPDGCTVAFTAGPDGVTALASIDLRSQGIAGTADLRLGWDGWADLLPRRIRREWQAAVDLAAELADGIPVPDDLSSLEGT